MNSMNTYSENKETRFIPHWCQFNTMLTRTLFWQKSYRFGQITHIKPSSLKKKTREVTISQNKRL